MKTKVKYDTSQISSGSKCKITTCLTWMIEHDYMYC